MKIIGFILIICAFAGIAHAGLNSGAIMGFLIGLALMVPEYIMDRKSCCTKNNPHARQQ